MAVNSKTALTWKEIEDNAEKGKRQEVHQVGWRRSTLELQILEEHVEQDNLKATNSTTSTRKASNLSTAWGREEEGRTQQVGSVMPSTEEGRHQTT